MCKLNIHRLVYATKTRQRAKVFHDLTLMIWLGTKFNIYFNKHLLNAYHVLSTRLDCVQEQQED